MNNKNKGFSLIEMMVSLSLGLFLLLILGRIYVWQLELNQQLQDLAVIQDNGRIATQLLLDNVRNAKQIIIDNPHALQLDNVSDTIYFFARSNGLYRRVNDDKAVEMVEGINVLDFEAIKKNQQIVGVDVTLGLQGPHGLKVMWPSVVMARRMIVIPKSADAPLLSSRSSERSEREPGSAVLRD